MRQGRAEKVFKFKVDPLDPLFTEIDERLPGPLRDFLAAGEHPAMEFVIEGFALAAQAGLDVLNPETAAELIQAGLRRCAEDNQRMKDNPGYWPAYWHTKVAEAELRHERGCLVYFMRLGNRVKIGYTSKLKDRLSAIRPEELMATERGGRRRERELHQRFDSYRVSGEWFSLEGEVADYISTLQEVQRDRGAAG